MSSSKLGPRELGGALVEIKSSLNEFSLSSIRANHSLSVLGFMSVQGIGNTFLSILTSP